MSLLTKAGVLGQKVIFKLKGVSPQIRTAAGIIGFFGAAVMIVKETRKAAPVFEEHKEKIEEIHGNVEDGKIDKKEAGKLYFKTYSTTAGKLMKCYWRSELLMGASTVLVISSTSSLAKSLSSTTATLAALDGKFKLAEQRTADKYGQDVADEIFHGIKKEIVASKEIDPETGEEKDVVEEHVVADKDAYPLYSIFFDSASREFEKGNPQYNYFFLKEWQSKLQDKINAGYFVTQNDILDVLGFDKLKNEYGMDWGYEKGDTIDFGLDDLSDVSTRRFLNGIEDVILIKFKGMHPLRTDLQKAYGYKKV